jgi:hypothetical protein
MNKCGCSGPPVRVLYTNRCVICGRIMFEIEKEPKKVSTFDVGPVLCHSKDHNEPHGCSNQKCWKFREV